MRRLPPLETRRVFEAAARLLSFKEAADELNVTASAVSHCAAALEEELGTPLFLRHTRRIELTGRLVQILPGEIPTRWSHYALMLPEMADCLQ